MARENDVVGVRSSPQPTVLLANLFLDELDEAKDRSYRKLPYNYPDVQSKKMGAVGDIDLMK